MVRTIFSKLYIAQDVARYKVKKGFETFDNRQSAVCDPDRHKDRTLKHILIVDDRLREQNEKKQEDDLVP